MYQMIKNNLFLVISMSALLSTVQPAIAKTDVESANKPQIVNQNDFGEYGIWSGKIYNFFTTELESDLEDNRKIVVANCGEQPYIFLKNKGSLVPLYNGIFEVIANSNNYIMSQIINGDIWGGWLGGNPKLEFYL